MISGIHMNNFSIFLLVGTWNGNMPITFLGVHIFAFPQDMLSEQTIADCIWQIVYI